MDFFISILIMIVLLRITWGLWKNYRNHHLVSRTIKREIRPIEKKLKFWEGEPDRQHQLLKPVYNVALFDLYPRLRIPRNKLERLIHKQLNRIVKHPIQSIFFQAYQFVKILLIITMLFISTLSVEQVIVEFKSFSIETLVSSYKGTSDEEVGREINGVTPEVKVEKTDKMSDSEVKDTPTERTAIVSETEGTRGESIYYLLPMNTYPNQVTTTEELGAAIAYHMEQLDDSFTIQFLGDAATFDQATTDVWEWLIHNQAFWMSFYEDSFLQYIDYGTHIDLEISMSYSVTPEQLNEIYESVETIINSMPENLTDYEKIKYVNDYIVDHTVYELDSEESPYTPYSIFMKGEGVCNGYTLATWLLLYALQIENLYVSGDVEGGLHAWNLVKLEGEWYHLDTTWNDPVYTGFFKWLGEPTYDYFLISDKEMKRDHKWEYELYPETAKNSYKKPK